MIVLRVTTLWESHREAGVLKGRKLEEGYAHCRWTHRASPSLWNPVHNEKHWQVPFFGRAQENCPSVQTDSFSTNLRAVSIHPPCHLESVMLGIHELLLAQRHETAQASGGPARTALLRMLHGGDHTMRGPINRRGQGSDLTVCCGGEAPSLNQDLHHVLGEITHQFQMKDLKDTKDGVRGHENTMMSGTAPLVGSCTRERGSAQRRRSSSSFCAFLQTSQSFLKA